MSESREIRAKINEKEKKSEIKRFAGAVKKVHEMIQGFLKCDA